MSLISNPIIHKAADTHFALLYITMAKCPPPFHGQIETTAEGITRYITGSPDPFDNAILPSSTQLNNEGLNSHVISQLHHFSKKNIPFAWHVKSDIDPELESTLTKQGFEKQNPIHAVAGIINEIAISTLKPSQQKKQNNYTICHIENENELHEFTKFIINFFAYPEELQPYYSELYKQPIWSHWVVKNNNEIVSTISTMIQDGTVSFWNAATTEGYRRKGLNNLSFGLKLLNI